MMDQTIVKLLFGLALLLIDSDCKDFDELNLKLKNCKVNEYHDITTLGCLQCPANQTSHKDKDPFSCTCKLGFTLSIVDGKRVCMKCPKRHITSTDGQYCIRCSENQVYNETSLQCEVCSGNDTIAVDHYLNGSSTGSILCVKCQENLVADKYSRWCIPCHSSLYEASQGLCKCPGSSHEMIQGICALKTNLASIPDMRKSYVITFDNEEYESKLFHDFYRIAAYSCNFLKNSTSCQLLANLCVLLHYSYDNELNACSYYRATFGEKVIDLPKYVPMLYYDKNSAKQILSNTSFEAKVSLRAINKKLENNTNSKFNLIVAQYSLSGKLLSYDSIVNVFHFCPELIPRVEGLNFGNTFHSKCRLSAQFVLHHHTTEFYDIFLHYYIDKELKLHSIPVLNLNYELDSAKINLGEKKKWQLTRRLFLIDNVSGRIMNKNKEAQLPEFVRYAESIEIFIQLQRESAKGSIYPPYLKIRYREVTIKELRSLFHIDLSFKVTYLINFEKTLDIISITTGVACVCATLLALIKTWSSSRRCGSLRIDITSILHFICLECGYIANCFFFIICFICCVWVFIFKFQDMVWILLPGDGQESIIKQYIISAFSLKIVHVIYVIYTQITIDLFLIDWEQPKAQSASHSLKSASNHIVGDKKRENFVSIWRTYFIANEWNELQTHRKVNVPFVLFVMIFCLKVLNYEDISRSAISNNSPKEYTPFSFIIRFTLSVVLFMIISFIESLYKVIIYERYIKNKLQMFVDLCSMANISVLIFKHRLYGFYIHGRSVYNEADLDLRSLYENMKREEKDLCQRRGLEPSSECQTFEVRVTSKFRTSYDSILETFEEIPTNTHPKNRTSSTNRIELCIEAHEQMKKFLTIFLQHGIKGLDFIVREKLFLESALDLEFQEPKQKSLFFRDHCHSFDKVLLYGEETVFLTFEVMVFTFVDLFATDFILASAVTYLIHIIIKTLRYRGGKRNMVYKTLVDERFLI